MKDINATYDLSRDSHGLRKFLKQLGAEVLEEPRQEIVNEAHEVLLLIGGQVERLELSPEKVYHLGRFDEPTEYEIDLDPYDAIDRGVSRVHASLFIQGDELHIMDNGSTNGTYVQGQRVRGDNPVKLSKGSQIMLGLLRIQVMFR